MDTQLLVLLSTLKIVYPQKILLMNAAEYDMIEDFCLLLAAVLKVLGVTLSGHDQ